MIKDEQHFFEQAETSLRDPTDFSSFVKFVVLSFDFCARREDFPLGGRGELCEGEAGQ